VVALGCILASRKLCGVIPIWSESFAEMCGIREKKLSIESCMQSLLDFHEQILKKTILKRSSCAVDSEHSLDHQSTNTDIMRGKIMTSYLGVP
jgi:hypothetical protein